MGTESCALGTRTSPGDSTVGHCGIPFDNMEVRLQSVPDMKYLVTDTIMLNGKKVSCPRGEIQMRGPSIFKGYYKQADKTEGTMDKDWLLSGDIGRINPNGTVSIIDRKKNIFKTAFGEYIAVEKVEDTYKMAPPVNQLWVYGNSYKTKIVAVVVPDTRWTVDQLKAHNLWQSTGEKPFTPEFAKKFTTVAGANKPLLTKLLLAEMKKVEGSLSKIERVQGILLETKIDDDPQGLMQGFHVDNGCLTPTMKLRRPNLLNRYRDQLKGLYTTLGEPPKPNEEW